MSEDPVLVEVVRNGFVESVHRGRVVVTDPDGTVAWAVGDAEAPCYPRSSVKPLQAVGLLRHGLDLDGELLALSGASHSGEPFHLDGVRRILAGVGLDEGALQNTPDLPVDEPARSDWIRSGRGPESISQNCSGKHAAMLRTAVRMGADVAHYRDPDHPVQRACHDAIAALAGETPTHPGVDGCGAPLWAVGLAGLARAFGRLAGAQDGPERRIADAFRAHPTYASGTTRDEVDLHRGVPGLVCKVGAEGVHALGLPDGRGIAIKIADGTTRPRTPVAVAVLRGLGHTDPLLDRHAVGVVLGHGEPVGAVRVVEGLTGGLEVRPG